MKYLMKCATVLLLLVSWSQATTAREPDGKKKSLTNLIKSRAATCAPASAQTDLELNNVRARLRVPGRMWQDEATSSAAYEIPKGSGQTAIYAGSLWMGGVDVSGQLRLAAAMFGGGNDFWGGPLTADGFGSIGPEVCSDYDRFFRVTKAEVLEFNSWWLCQQDPDCTWDNPNYQPPQSILEWPAHGDESKGQDYYLAPFWDRPDETGAGNGLYDPINDGDYPGYDLFNEVTCNKDDRTVYLRGDETIWWVFNDNGNIHTESGGEPIGIEVKAQAFAFATNDEINNMTFYNYELLNRGTQTLYDTYFAQWVDADVGLSLIHI